MSELSQITSNNDCSIYKIINASSELVTSLISSTKESRAIVNDPLVYGYDYTDKLKVACAKTFKSLEQNFKSKIGNTFNQDQTCVLNILRGGLNFGLRDALHEAYNWNRHAAAFLSAQRARQNSNPEEWYITESSYQKVYLPKNATIVLGDVVATGTSLEYALNQLLNIAKTQKEEITSLIFFTIGGPRTHEIIEAISERAKLMFPSFTGSYVIYFEGCFSVATPETEISIKYTGTDLLRTKSDVAPEFVESQFENPCYPLERCTIYDAGSRAFWIPEYLEDVKDYWEKTLELANQGMTFRKLIEERYPELLNHKTEKQFEYEKIDLIKLCHEQIEKL